MKIHATLNTLFILILASAFPLSSIAQVSGQAIGFSCSGCHGTDGLLEKPGFPKLKSQSTQSLINKLLDFKYDRSPSSIMGRITKGYTDAELKAVADYFSHLE